MRVALKMTGVEEVKRALESLPSEVKDEALDKILRQAGRPILDAAKAKVPVKTGKLRDSLVIGRKLRDAKVRRGAAISIGSTSPLAHFQEFGTRKQAAQPFIRPAYDAGADAARRTIENGLLDAVSKAVQRARRTTRS